jgi:hypothetical protein
MHLQFTACPYLNSAPFWVIKQSEVVKSKGRFAITYRAIFTRQEMDFSTPENGIDRLPRNIGSSLPLLTG